MKPLDENRDEVRLSVPIVERLAGRFQFYHPPNNLSDEPSLVDIQATNERLALHGRPLDEWVAVAPRDPRVANLEDLTPVMPQIEAKHLAIVLLCGGLSFRSQGQIHPLLPVTDPITGLSETLLDRQLRRLENSPLQSAARAIVGTPLNEEALRKHLDHLPASRRPLLYVGGLAPRLLPVQPGNGPPLTYCEPSGSISYNPISHLEALRWLILSGTLAHFLGCQVIVTLSYSNWGRVYTAETLSIAAWMAHVFQEQPARLFVAEVAARPARTRSGSLLVSGPVEAEGFRLIKYSYGRGAPRLPSEDRILISTNTLYFHVPSLLLRLRQGAALVDLPGSPEAVTELLWDATAGHRRDSLAALFDVVFPVPPHLLPNCEDKPASFLRVERDLDQLSLIPGASTLLPLEVNPKRGVFVKVPSDIEDEEKRHFLFGT